MVMVGVGWERRRVWGFWFVDGSEDGVDDLEILRGLSLSFGEVVIPTLSSSVL